MGPLRGVRVLDLSRVLAGPWATQALGDLGATVYKIERPGSGDDTRAWGPPWLKDPGGADTRESAYFLAANRAKHSIALDITCTQGQALLRQLVQGCDVLVENFKVGGLAKYGLAAADLMPLNPRLIYCSISAFGQDGPLAPLAGYDAMIQGMGGLMSITGLPDGEPGAGPQKVGVAVVDLMTGMYAVSAITAALYEREKSGVGQHIDLALLDTQVAWLANQGMNYLISGHAPQRQGTAHPNIVPYQAFRTADGYLMLAVGNDRQFVALCAATARTDLASDERFATNAARVNHRAILIPIIQELLLMRTTRGWLDLLAPLAVPCGPINDLAQVFAEPQVQHRAMQHELPHPLAGRVPQIKNPVRFSRTAIEYQLPPPLLGQHTDQVLAEMGLSESEIIELKASGVVSD